MDGIFFGFYDKGTPSVFMGHHQLNRNPRLEKLCIFVRNHYSVFTRDIVRRRCFGGTPQKKKKKKVFMRHQFTTTSLLVASVALASPNQ